MSPHPTDPRPERSDASLRVIGLTAAVLALLVASGLAVSRAVYLHPEGRGRVAAPDAGGRFQDGPGQRTGIARDWAELDRETAARLGGYGWVDRRAGIVRIPIGRAMELTAERGGERP